MKKLLLFTITYIGLLICFSFDVYAQGVGINSSGDPADPSALLDLNAAPGNNKGLLVPRVSTAERDAITNPAQALQIYNLTTKCLEIWENDLWQKVWCATCPSPAQPSAISGNTSPCVGSSETYSVVAVSRVNYTWIFPAGWVQTAGGNTNSVTVTVGLGSGTIQVVPSTVCGNGTARTLAVTTLDILAAPTAGTNTLSATQINWNWNAVQGAISYKCNTVNDFSGATDNGTSTNYIQTGVTCNSSYTLYVWAYNTCGASPVTMLTQVFTGEATGGTITHIGSSTIHTFTSSGTFTLQCPLYVEVLIVAGGGGASTYNSGGGGGGGVIYQSSVSLTAQPYNIVIGAGGAGTNGSFSVGNLGNNGENSSAFGFTAIGGGGGGSRFNGANGGSGGGGGNNNTSGGSGTPGQGHNGGNGNGTGGISEIAAGGGGGAGTAGVSGVFNVVKGVGGDGLQFSISGTPTYYGGGGGGGASGPLTNPAGGLGGGGTGGCNCGMNDGTDGTPSTGGGAGGGGNNPSSPGATGGSGIVIVRYEIPCTTAPYAPTAGSHAAFSSRIDWNWSAVSGALGYKYNTINDYSGATDNGNSTTYGQTGLTCVSPYTLYVWAYNNCGVSTATTLIATTSTCCTEATGGTVSHVGGRTIHTFTSSGTFTQNCVGNVEVLIVAGGGGASTYNSGGGGGGGVIYQSSVSLTAQPYNIVIGAGGAGTNGSFSVGNLGNNGENSSAFGFTAIGGGGGGSRFNGANGGSGGGGGNNNTSGGSGTPGQGHNGGNGNGTGGISEIAAGGGGGAGTAGVSGVFNVVKGVGGDGLQFSISGTPTYYGGGGGGGASGPLTNPAGGLGGGGTGGCNCGMNDGTDGTPSTGGGAGGGGNNPSSPGATGGSGIVIVSYPTP